MAQATGIGINLSQVEAAVRRADESLKLLHSTGTRTAKELNEAFGMLKDGNVKDFVSVVDRLSNTLSRKGYNRVAQMVREVSTETTSAIDRVSRFSTLMQNITDGGRSRVKNGAIESLNLQIDESLSRLGVLNERLQFYTKGEGAKAVGANVVDTTGLQQEANQLRINIELLQRKLEHEQAVAALKQRSGAIERQQALDSNWGRMEANSIREKEQMYARMFDTIEQRERRYNSAKEEYARIDQRLIDQAGANKQRWNREAIQMVQKEHAARQKMYEDLFRAQAQLRSQEMRDRYQHIQGYGDTSNQAIAAYNRLYGGKVLFQ